jgi:hypothetical protein
MVLNADRLRAIALVAGQGAVTVDLAAGMARVLVEDCEVTVDLGSTPSTSAGLVPPFELDADSAADLANAMLMKEAVERVQDTQHDAKVLQFPSRADRLARAFPGELQTNIAALARTRALDSRYRQAAAPNLTVHEDGRTVSIGWAADDDGLEPVIGLVSDTHLRRPVPPEVAPAGHQVPSALLRQALEVQSEADRPWPLVAAAVGRGTDGSPAVVTQRFLRDPRLSPLAGGRSAAGAPPALLGVDAVNRLVVLHDAALLGDTVTVRTDSTGRVLVEALGGAMQATMARPAAHEVTRLERAGTLLTAPIDRRTTPTLSIRR